jgi:hypothetical protein
MSREIMQQALNVLEFNLPIIEDYGSKEQLTDCHRAITKLYKELAKPDQEECVCCGDYEKCTKPCTPRGRWQGEQNASAQFREDAFAWDGDAWGEMAAQMSRDFVERAKKNWESPPKGVGTITMAELRKTDLYRHIRAELGGELVKFKDGEWSYVRKPWQGLTEHEIWECQKPGLSDDVYKLIEAKLRQKNT